MDQSKTDVEIEMKKDKFDEYEEKSCRASIIIHPDLQTHQTSNVYYYDLKNDVDTVQQSHSSRSG